MNIEITPALGSLFLASMVVFIGAVVKVYLAQRDTEKLVPIVEDNTRKILILEGELKNQAEEIGDQNTKGSLRYDRHDHANAITRLTMWKNEIVEPWRVTVDKRFNKHSGTIQAIKTNPGTPRAKLIPREDDPESED